MVAVRRSRSRTGSWKAEALIKWENYEWSLNFTNGSFLDCHKLLFFRFWTWGILGTQTRRRDHKACPGEVNISGDKYSMFFSIIQNINWKMFSNTYFSFSSPMRAFEETSQQGGGGALEVAGGQQIDWQGQRIWNSIEQSTYLNLSFSDLLSWWPCKEGASARYQKIQSFKKPALPSPCGLGGAA